MNLKEIINKLTTSIDKLKVLQTEYIGRKKGEVYNTQRLQIENSINHYKSKLINYGKCRLFKVCFTFVSEINLIENREVYLANIEREEISFLIGTQYKNFTILLVEEIKTGLK